MQKVLIIFDRFNNVWLQNAEEPYQPTQWTDNESQCSFYEPEELESILSKIQKYAQGEVWIEVKEIYVNL